MATRIGARLTEEVEVVAEATASSATSQATWLGTVPTTREVATEVGAASNAARKGTWLGTVQTVTAVGSTGALTSDRGGMRKETTRTATGAAVAVYGASQPSSSQEVGTECEEGSSSTNADC